MTPNLNNRKVGAASSFTLLLRMLLAFSFTGQASSFEIGSLAASESFEVSTHNAAS
jgi:hypothetical protein